MDKVENALRSAGHFSTTPCNTRTSTSLRRRRRVLSTMFYVRFSSAVTVAEFGIPVHVRAAGYVATWACRV